MVEDVLWCWMMVVVLVWLCGVGGVVIVVVELFILIV